MLDLPHEQLSPDDEEDVIDHDGASFAKVELIICFDSEFDIFSVISNVQGRLSVAAGQSLDHLK